MKSPTIRDGTIAIIRADITTTGVYILENLRIKFSVLVFLLLEFSIKSIILLAVDVL